MRISVDRLFSPDVEAIEVDQIVRLRGGDLAARYSKGVRVNAKITRITHGVYMEGTIEGEERETCVRCLEPFARRTRVAVEETFSEDVGAKEAVFSDVAALVDRKIDLDELVTQLLEVDEPMAAVCSESCLGICPQCGGNRNDVNCACEEKTLDERWAGLSRLLNEADERTP